MHVKTVKASPKGQFTLPKEMFNALGGHKDLLLIQEGRKIIITPAEDAGRATINDLDGWEALALPAMTDVWDNDADEIWNDA